MPTALWSLLYKKGETMSTQKTLMFILLFLAGSSFCMADSIWAKRAKTMKQPYADDTARQIGDVLTIKITESSTVDNKQNRDLKKSTNRSAAFNGVTDIAVGEVELLPRIPSINLNANSNMQLNGKADHKDERKFEDSITVVVIDVLPNKNLVVRGTRDRDIAADTQSIEVTGIVRPSDIAFDNSVKSERVADFRIVNKNGGVAEPYSKPGWFDSIVNIVWPF
jgi:flagellar L-ring protein FlgH